MNRFAAFDDSDNEDTKKVVAPVTKQSNKKAATPAPEVKPVVVPVEASKAKPSKPSNRKPKVVVDAAPIVAEVVADTTGNWASSGDFGGDFGGDFEAPKDNTKRGKDNYMGSKKNGAKGVKNSDKIHHVTAIDNPSVKPDNRRHDGAHIGGRGPRKPRPNKDAVSTDVATEEEPVVTETAETTDSGAWPSSEPETTTQEPVVEKEPEPVRRTMDEYLQIREEARANSSVLLSNKPLRAVEEALGNIKIKEEVTVGVYVCPKDTNKKAPSKQAKVKTLFTDLSFNGDEEASPEEESRGRGGAGRGGGGFRNGGGGRGGGGERRSPRTNAKIDISDASAFPSL